MEWKIAKLALIRKLGKRNIESPSSFRPICLLDEIEKVLDRIIGNRIKSHLSQEGPKISISMDSEKGAPQSTQ